MHQKLYLFKHQQVWATFSKVHMYVERVFSKVLFSKDLLYTVKPRIFLPPDYLFIV